MASISKYGKGYRAQVFVGGVRQSKTFRMKRDAEAWAATTEVELKETVGDVPVHTRTVREMLTRYKEEVTPTKRGARWDTIRIESYLADPMFPSDKRLCDVTPEDFGIWRDLRLKTVTSGTVRRDFSQLSPIFETARREWKWVEVNPLKDVRKPREPDHREVIISVPETLSMLRAMHYSRGPCRSATQAVAVAFLFALRTGMRAGEICALKWEDVSDGFVQVTGTSVGAGKTSAARRKVPLTYQADRLLKSMEGWGDDTVFGINASTLDAFFRRYRDRAGLSGFTFHDSRHTAATRIANKVDVLTLCKIFGWKNTKQALVYYNPKVEDIRKMLEPRRA